jgi:hypothetical protein
MAVKRNLKKALPNVARAEWAHRAVTKFQTDSGLGRADGLDIAMIDLLCDLQHLCDRETLEFERLLSRAMGHYEAERTVRGKASDN